MEKESKRETLKISDNYSELNKKRGTPTKNYNKIYSDFLYLPINNKNIYNSINNLNEDEINIYNFIINDADTSQIIEMEKINNKLNNHIPKIKSNHNKTKYIPISSPSKCNYKDVVERLYHYNYLTKSKINNMRKLQDYNFKKNSNPKISERAKKIKKDDNRLYNENIIKKMRKLSQSNIKEKDKNFSFSPKININSLKIAENLEPSSSRLLKKKINLTKDEINQLTKENYFNLFRNKMHKKYLRMNYNNNYNSKNLNRSMGEISTKMNDFYERQMKLIEKKEKRYNDNKIIKEKEYQKYSFIPKINHKKTEKSMSIKNNISIFERLYNTKKAGSKKNVFKEDKTLSNDLYTFKPKISPLKIKTDKKVIQYNTTSNNLYILKRRKYLENSKHFNEECINKSKPVIIDREYRLRTEKRFKSKGNKTPRYDDNKKYIVSKGTIDFNNNRKERIYYYLNDENNITINIVKYKNINQNLNQKQYMNAIIDLHNQIGNLDI